jgi:predicted pyridoxine 5'-phosphate oxidase superfamily flavin-nucleotide-binding protein
LLHKWLEIASTPAVKAARERYGSAAQYARLDGTLDPDGPVRNDRLTDAEGGFIAARDGFYLASVSETGWPYVQYRGGPAGFLRVIDERTLGYADLRGNRQYVTTGNVVGNDRVALFLMDYAHQRRLKIFGRMRIVDASADPELADKLAVSGYGGRVERAVLVTVEAFDWNCPQHITPRFTQSELEQALAPVRDTITALRAENERLHSPLGERAEAVEHG